MAARRGGVTVPISTEFNSRGLEEANRQLSSFGKTIRKSFLGVGATIGAAFALGAITDQIRDTIAAGSRLQESQSKVGVVFGDSAIQINKWADSAATAMVMSKQAALEAAGTFGNLFQAFGIGQGKAMTMSTTLVQLAADLASFNNTSTEDAIQAIRSGLSGETEPLKRFGVALNDARLKAEAFNMGIYDGKGVLDAQQKSLAAYAIIMKDTTLAQGDVARTADNYANTMRAVSSAVENAQATIGTKLVDAIGKLSSSLGGSQGAAAGIEQLGNGAAGLIDQMSALADAIARVNSEAQRQQTQDQYSQDGWRKSVQLIPVVGTWLVWLSGLSEEAARAEGQLADEIARSIQMRHIYNPVVDASARAVRDESKYANEAADAYDKLNGAMEKRNSANRSIIGANIRLREMRAQGPQDRNGDGKISMDERRAFGLDYATTLDQKYNALIAKNQFGRANRLLERGRAYLGEVVSTRFANNILQTPPELATARTAQRRANSEAGASEWRRSMSSIFSGDVTIVVQALTPAEAVQKSKEWARLAATGRGPALPVNDPGRGFTPPREVAPRPMPAFGPSTNPF